MIDSEPHSGGQFMDCQLGRTMMERDGIIESIAKCVKIA